MEEEIGIKLSFRVEFGEDPGQPAAFVTGFSGEISVWGLEEGGESTEVGSMTVCVADLAGGRKAGYVPGELFDDRTSTACFRELLIGCWATGGGAVWRPRLRRLLQVGPVSGRILLIDRVEINEAYRGRNLGHSAINAAIKHLGFGCDFVTLKPFPLQFEAGHPVRQQWEASGDLEGLRRAEKAATRKLELHYGRIGFKKLAGTSLMVRGVKK